MPRKPDNQMLSVLHAVMRNAGVEDLGALVDYGHRIEAMYRCTCRGLLKWLANSGRYEITDAGRAAIWY